MFCFIFRPPFYRTKFAAIGFSTFCMLCAACGGDSVKKEMYPNGKIRFEIPYDSEGKRSGIAKEFYQSGTLKKETPYQNDKKEGLEIEFYESGTKRSEYPYQNGYIEGIVTTYHENGNIESRAPYSQNKQIDFGEHFDSNGAPQTQGSYKDPRDSHAYEWVRIGTQVWLAENADFATAVGSLCMQCNNWGRLYNAQAAENACPPGFRLPTSDDWKLLIQNAGQKPGYALKAGVGWDPLKGTSLFGNGSDSLGFGAKSGGAHFAASDVAYESRKFKDAGQKAYFRTSDHHVAVLYYNSDVVRIEPFNDTFGASVRCILK